MEEQKKNDRPAPERRIIKEFARDGVIVQVQKTLGYRSRYALLIGVKFKDKPDWLNKFLPLSFGGEGRGKVELLGPNPGVIEALIRDAQDYACDCKQQDEDERIEAQLARENRDANRGKPQVRHTGKTERRRERHRAGATNGG